MKRLELPGTDRGDLILVMTIYLVMMALLIAGAVLTS
jgi:hypothetical protein